MPEIEFRMPSKAPIRRIHVTPGTTYDPDRYPEPLPEKKPLPEPERVEEKEPEKNPPRPSPFTPN